MILSSKYITIGAITTVLFNLPKTLSYSHLPYTHDAAAVNVDSLLQHTTSRNNKIITEAVEFIISLQSAPTCTRMAAGHLMNECKLLEHAPDFAKSRPEAYLDKVKTEYAAKLAVCELLSAQPINPIPPPHCEILVPSSKACGTSGGWWYSRPETTPDKQCYPGFNDRQYMQCLKGLQSTPQFWTSFSNARQNAVVMCQASRDAIERESNLEMFKNLTQVLGVVTSSMERTTEGYQTLVREQRRFSDEARSSHHQLKRNIQAVQEKAVATVSALDEKFHAFMKVSISDLIAALADNQSDELDRVHQRMQNFSQNLILESSQLAEFFTEQLHEYHGRALLNLKSHHEAQIDSYNTLSERIDDANARVKKTSDVSDVSLAKADIIVQRLMTLESQTENIAEGFAFLSAVPNIITSLLHGCVVTFGSLFIFAMIYRINTRFATYAAGACSSAYLFHTSGVFVWLNDLPSRITNIHAQRSISIVTSLSTTQKSASIILLLWLSAHPISRVNSCVGHVLSTAFTRLLATLWIHEYSNTGGVGLLPSVEMPDAPPHYGSEVAIDHGRRNLASHAYDKDSPIAA